MKVELSYDLAIPFLDIYQEKTIIQKHICTPMSIDRMLDKEILVHIYNELLLSC